jgi:aspartyl-tRNA(Asn)/glutamyl-tRNA(Gln) amidotransferase subunit A
MRIKTVHYLIHILFFKDFCTQPANMAGIPALSLPIKLSQRGLPLSLQIMAPIHCDELLFDVGKFIETNSYFPHKNGVLL